MFILIVDAWLPSHAPQSAPQPFNFGLVFLANSVQQEPMFRMLSFISITHIQDDFDTSQINAQLASQSLNQPHTLNIFLREHPNVTARPTRQNQPNSLVMTQRLWVYFRHLCNNTDKEGRPRPHIFRWRPIIGSAVEYHASSPSSVLSA